MIVVLTNEDGVETYWFIPFPVTSAAGAKREAWRGYRELKYRDNEFPPKWTKARVLGRGTLVMPVL